MHIHKKKQQVTYFLDFVDEGTSIKGCKSDNICGCRKWTHPRNKNHDKSQICSDLVEKCTSIKGSKSETIFGCCRWRHLRKKKQQVAKYLLILSTKVHPQSGCKSQSILRRSRRPSVKTYSPVLMFSLWQHQRSHYNRKHVAKQHTTQLPWGSALASSPWN